jgi:dihydrofolate reductase
MAVVAEVRRSPGKDIRLVGGGPIVVECLNRGLIDEFQVFVHPTVAGDGIRLFPLNVARRKLVLVGSRSFSSGLVELNYRKEDAPSDKCHTEEPAKRDL